MSKDVTFEGKGLTLAGTMLTPGGTPKAPAMLLLPGSGPTDRDGNSIALPDKVDSLKQIAEELAKNGIASLRFDKRAIRRYQDKWPKDLGELNKFFSWQSFVDDASAALDFLRKQPEIDATRVGILGHSEGAMISLQVAADRSGQSNAPKVTILLGGTGRPMGPVLHEQIARALKKQGASAQISKQYLDYLDAACAALAAGKALPPNTPAGLAALFNPTVLDIMGAYCRIDPSANAAKTTGPVLVMNGENDTQVSAERDAPKLIAALKGRASGDVDSLIVPKASHNFKSTADGNDDAFTGPVVPAALAKIVEFAKKSL